MTQNIVDLSGDFSGNQLLDDVLPDLLENLYTNHAGTSRPSYVLEHMTWLDITTDPRIWYYFDGTTDIPIGTFDQANNRFTPARQIDPWCGSTAGTANAQTLTPAIPRNGYAAGDPFEALITLTNTAEGPTINVSGQGAKTVKVSVGAGKVNLPIGGLQNGMIARFVYDGTDLILLNIRPFNASANIATAGTLNLDNSSGDYILLTGTTTVTAITLGQGSEKTCRANGDFTLTHGSSLLLPGAKNIAVKAGDIMVFRGEASGVVRLVAFQGGTGRKEVATWLIAYPANKDYKWMVNSPYPFIVEEVTTICASGTCTATTKINTTALGGTANSVSTSEQSQAHSSANVGDVGDDLVTTISSNSSCVDMTISMKIRFLG